MVDQFSQSENLQEQIEAPQQPPLRARFEMLEKIGEGGMGTVYKARQIATDRIVAIKMLSAEFSQDAARRKRFEQEAKAAGSFYHPNLVAIVDVGCEDNNAYIVMEYIPGKGLDEILRSKQRLDPHELVEIFSQICKGMSHVHHKGVVHRDLKPSNVMVAKDESGEFIVKIVDFGIVKADRTKAGAITQTGELLGSPLYMSPEQATGQPVDTRSDIYSLGCMLYEAATGKPPFVGENPVATLCMRLNQDAAPFDQVAPFACLPQKLEKIVERAMKRDPNERYQTMAAIQSDLKELSRDHPRPAATAQGVKSLRHVQQISAPHEAVNTNVRWKEVAALISVIVVLAGAAAGIATLKPEPKTKPTTPPAQKQPVPSPVVAPVHVTTAEERRAAQETDKLKSELKRKELEIQALEKAKQEEQAKRLKAEKQKLLSQINGENEPAVPVAAASKLPKLPPNSSRSPFMLPGPPLGVPAQPLAPEARPKLSERVQDLLRYGELPPQAAPNLERAIQFRGRRELGACRNELIAALDICRDHGAGESLAAARIHRALSDVFIELGEPEAAFQEGQDASELKARFNRPKQAKDLWEVGNLPDRVQQLMITKRGFAPRPQPHHRHDGPGP